SGGKTDRGTFYGRREKGRTSYRKTIRLRGVTVSTPGARRSYFQLAPSTTALRKRRQITRDPGRSRTRPGRLRLSHHGNSTLSVRRQPSGDQCYRWRALQGSNRSSDPVRAGTLGQRSARNHGSRREGQDFESKSSQGLAKLGTAGAFTGRGPAKIRWAFNFGRRALASSLCW